MGSCILFSTILTWATNMCITDGMTLLHFGWNDNRNRIIVQCLANDRIVKQYNLIKEDIKCVEFDR